jgi:hypothetical protein
LAHSPTAKHPCHPDPETLACGRAPSLACGGGCINRLRTGPPVVPLCKSGSWTWTFTWERPPRRARRANGFQPTLCRALPPVPQSQARLEGGAQPSGSPGPGTGQSNSTAALVGRRSVLLSCSPPLTFIVARTRATRGQTAPAPLSLFQPGAMSATQVDARQGPALPPC